MTVDGDGVPEECDQTIIDCNQNGVPDECDIQWQISEDCNGNHIPDKCEISVESTAPSGGPFFCTTNCDPDCNNNGMPDACEDCNGNGRADECDILDGVSLDLNGNRIPDECDPDPIIIYVDDRNTGPPDRRELVNGVPFAPGRACIGSHALWTDRNPRGRGDLQTYGIGK